jgi:hypothetical protein
MTHQAVIPAGGLSVLAAVGLLATIQVSAQQSRAAAGTAEPAARTYSPARTPDGQPDLQGYWTNSTYTPLQRPSNVTKEFYTAEEAAAIEKRAAEREREETVPGTAADVHYDEAQFGLNRSQSTVARNLRTSLIVDPPNGKIPPLTAEGEKRLAAREEARARQGIRPAGTDHPNGRWDAVQNNSLDDRCIITGHAGPPMLNAGYNSTYQIVQGPGYVMVLVENNHVVRMIPLDGRPGLPVNVRAWTGISRGRWEGNTLVVETSNFNTNLSIPGTAQPAFWNAISEHMRVTEWFTRVSADTIQYRFTVEDPATWTRPWTAELPMVATQGPIFEHACHEGNYGLYNTLAAARAEEKKAAEEAVKKGTK